jgi:quercetin dioxygenase-like cupin family protein
MLFGASGSASAQSEAAGARDGFAPDGSVVPVHDEPHHRQLFQYGPMRILELQVPPGDESWFHLHEWPVLYMTLSQSRTRTEVLGAEPSSGGRSGGPPPAARQGGAAPGGRQAAAGRAGRGAPAFGRGAEADLPQPRAPRAFGNTGYIDNPVTHRITNVGDRLFHAMVVINETLGDDSMSAEQAGFDLSPEYENDWFRSYRIRLEPGETTPVHEHHTPVVILQGTVGKGTADGPMDWEFNKPGQWAFYDVGTAHTISNIGDTPMEYLEIEVREP